MRVHNLFFCSILITTTALVKCSDSRGISYCDHFPESPYVCQPCIRDLNNESLSKCTCLYGDVLKNEPNLNCPYHREKYLKWLDDNEMREDYNKIAHPELEEQRQKSYNLPPSTSSSATTTSTSTTYHPVFQSLSSSTPAKKGSSEKAAYKEYKKQKKERIKRTKSEKKEKRSSQEKSKSTPSSLRSSAEKQVRFGIVPEEIDDHPRVMRRGEKPADKKEYEKRRYSSDDE